jgi:hypothetical protein
VTVEGRRELASIQTVVSPERDRNMGDFIGSTWFFVIMIVILLGLGGLWWYLHNKADED